MVTVTEGTFTIGSQELYTKTWLPDGAPPRAKLIVVHGFSDHIDRYYEFFPTLAARGIAVYGFDQRGWGRSVKKPADRGRTGPTATVLSDIVAFLQPHLDVDGDADGDGAAAAAAAAVPVFVLGHSMGGNEVATLMAAPVGSSLETGTVRKVRGWLLEAPFFGFAAGEAPSALKVAAGRLAGRLLPNFQLKNPIPAEYMSRDPAVVADVRQDALCHDTGTLEGLAALLDRVGDLASSRCPPGPGVTSLWLGHGDADPCTSFAASKAWFDTSAARVPDRTFRAYAGWLHQLHAEPVVDRQLFYKEVGDWILARSGEAAEAAAATTAAAAPTANEPTAGEPVAVPANTDAAADKTHVVHVEEAKL
ncbi:alpha beta hydrolase fold family [Niveomyces insectorum RCEF 264]|uniref:Alpha beta hydrolase fold family n=1 Tax=Niveomyces insectorum RCEF 264 TaxID=1081102 RepID=A0A167X4K6_9HYPO|nr:alpha beta hydrolase fold family [Niveomyces insectorum RCEF 264]